MLSNSLLERFVLLSEVTQLTHDPYRLTEEQTISYTQGLKMVISSENLKSKFDMYCLAVVRERNESTIWFGIRSKTIGSSVNV